MSVAPEEEEEEAIPVPGWTDVLDPVGHPLTRPNQLYINTNYGTLDLAAGTFTAGKEGVYTYHLHLVSENETVSQQAYAGISVNYVDVTNPGLLQTSIPTIEDWSAYPVSTSPLIADIGQVYLNVGDVVRVVASFDVYDYASEVFPVDNNSYKLNLWSMSYASSIPGATGPAGPAGPTVTLVNAGAGNSLVNDGTGADLAVKSVSAGAGISITSTSTNIEVALSGPPPFIGFNAYLVLDQPIGGPMGTLTGWNTGIAPPYTFTAGGLAPSGSGVTIPTTGYYSVNLRVGTDTSDTRVILQNDTFRETYSTSETVNSFSISDINCIIYCVATTVVRVLVDSACTVISGDLGSFTTSSYGYASRWSMQYLGP